MTWLVIGALGAVSGGAIAVAVALWKHALPRPAGRGPTSVGRARAGVGVAVAVAVGAAAGVAYLTWRNGRDGATATIPAGADKANSTTTSPYREPDPSTVPDTITTTPSTSSILPGTTSSTTNLPTTTSLPRVTALRGAEDVPGVPLGLNQSVTSVVDMNTRPRDVFAINLTAGQAIDVRLDMGRGGYVDIANPGSPSLRTSETVTYGFQEHTLDEKLFMPFTPAVTGTYSVIVRASGTAQPYALTLIPRNTITALQGAEDVPGVPLGLNQPVTSVLDKNMRPREVFAVDLTAGQTIDVRLEIGRGGFVDIANPGSPSLVGSGAVIYGFKETTLDGKLSELFTAAVTGTYYVIVMAPTIAQPYTLTLVG